MSGIDQLSNGRHEVKRLKRLGHDTVRGGDPAAGRLDASGQHHDADRGLRGAELVEEVAAVARAEVDVEHDDLDVLALELAARRVQGRGLEHPEPLQLEIHPAEQPKRWLVVHDEHGAPRRHAAEASGRGPYLPRATSRLQVVNAHRAFPYQRLRAGQGARASQGTSTTDHCLPPSRVAALSTRARSAVDAKALQDRAALSRSSARSLPRSSRLSNNPGDTFEPVTAILIDANASRGLRPSRSASSRSAGSIASAVNGSTSPSARSASSSTAASSCCPSSDTSPKRNPAKSGEAPSFP